MKSLIRFGISGLAATAIHVVIFTALMELTSAPAVIASVPAFCGALLASYALNYHWTFMALNSHRLLLPRFALVATLGLSLNVFLTYLVVDWAGFWYGYALATVITVVPVVTYVLSRYWVFRSAD